jgi:hypothetical protein
VAREVSHTPGAGSMKHLGFSVDFPNPAECEPPGAVSSYTLEGSLVPSMPPITALLHTRNAGLRLSRALETLVPCAEILIVDHGSSDATIRVAREYGARVVPANTRATADPYHYLDHALYDWILCLDPSESITEGLQATLFEWSSLPAPSTGAASFSFFVREQIAEAWRIHPLPETRLIPRGWTLWNGSLPANDPSSIVLEGEMLQLAYP